MSCISSCTVLLGKCWIWSLYHRFYYYGHLSHQSVLFPVCSSANSSPWLCARCRVEAVGIWEGRRWHGPALSSQFTAGDGLLHRWLHSQVPHPVIGCSCGLGREVIESAWGWQSWERLCGGERSVHVLGLQRWRRVDRHWIFSLEK